MTRAYVDTTVLVNILLKRGPIQKSCVDSLSRYQSAEVPTYALKEMKAGPLYAWIWLHNKCVACQSCAKVLRALHGMASSRKRNLPLTAIEAWEEIARSDSATLAMLVKKYGRDASDDVVKCERLRLGLRRRITTAWRDRHRAIPVVEPLACYEDSDLEVDKFGMINPWPIECDPTPNCSLAAEMAKEPSRIRRLHAAVESCPAKAENTRRLKALRHIFRTGKRPIDDSMCRSLGDAVFAFFAPIDSVILTTNLSDHKPLAEALGKSAESP